MPIFLVTKKMTAYLAVDCTDIEEARTWGDRIVATLEDEDGRPIPVDAIDDFEADFYPREMTVELLPNDDTGPDVSLN